MQDQGGVLVSGYSTFLKATWKKLVACHSANARNGIEIILALAINTANQTVTFMTRGNNILLAALGGAAIGALIGTALSTEKGRQMVESASNTIKDLSGKATEYAKQNIGDVIRETKESIGGVVKEKIAEKVKQ